MRVKVCNQESRYGSKQGISKNFNSLNFLSFSCFNCFVIFPFSCFFVKVFFYCFRCNFKYISSLRYDIKSHSSLQINFFPVLRKFEIFLID